MYELDFLKNIYMNLFELRNFSNSVFIINNITTGVVYTVHKTKVFPLTNLETSLLSNCRKHKSRLVGEWELEDTGLFFKYELQRRSD